METEVECVKKQMEVEAVLRQLSEMHGISGFEGGVAAAVAELFAPFVDEVTTDALGSVIAVKKSKKQGAKRIMLDAHLDEIGLMVTKIDEKGFLKFTSVGGVDERILPAREVVVHGKRDIPGIIGIKPPHLQSADESKKTLKMEELAIDIGMDENAAKNVVEAGAWVTFSQACAPLMHGQLTGKSFDDRASVCALLYAVQMLADEPLDADVYFVLSAQEETNLGGAKCAAYSIEPDAALVIDVTHAKTPDHGECPFEVGGGVAYSLGPNVHTPFAKLIKALAEELGVGAKEEVDGGSTGTNAWAVQVSRTGVATAVLSLPLKYMHTPTEVVSAADIAAAGELACAFVRRLSADAALLNPEEIR